MKETMHDCYRSQFSCMGHILAHKDELLKRFVEFYASNQLDRIYLLGSGTSYTACATAAPYMERILKVDHPKFFWLAVWKDAVGDCRFSKRAFYKYHQCD